MVKVTESGVYYSSHQPSRTFKTFVEASHHDAYAKITGEATRPDSRDDVMRMTDEAFKIPMAKTPDRLALLEASLKKGAVDPAFRPGIPIGEVLLHNVKAMRREAAEADDKAAEAAEWTERPLIKNGLVEAKRLLAEAENDFTRDRAEVVKAEQLVAALSTVNADEGWIRSQLRTLLGVESQRIENARAAAGAALAEAQAKVNALGSAQQVAVRVPVDGDDLLSKGNSYTANLMSAGAPPEQLAAAFDAMDKAFAGDMGPLTATLEANGGEA